MTGKDAYKIWAPSGKKWVDWVRPVPFVEVDKLGEVKDMSPFVEPDITFTSEAEEHTALIVDLPGQDSVKEGIALARLGYRPIPIYNGTAPQQGARSTVDNHHLVTALVIGAVRLADIDIIEDAPPAFLTDSNRMNRYKMEDALFDNSWDVYHQDLPSAEYFLNNGIRKIVVVGKRISKDLHRIFYPFPKKGIEIFYTDGYQEPKRVKLGKLPRKDREE